MARWIVDSHDLVLTRFGICFLWTIMIPDFPVDRLKKSRIDRGGYGYFPPRIDRAVKSQVKTRSTFITDLLDARIASVIIHAFGFTNGNDLCSIVICICICGTLYNGSCCVNLPPRPRRLSSWLVEPRAVPPCHQAQTQECQIYLPSSPNHFTDYQ